MLPISYGQCRGCSKRSQRLYDGQCAPCTAYQSRLSVDAGWQSEEEHQQILRQLDGVEEE